jgi:hypothetical protein
MISKTNVRELAAITIDDKISKDSIKNYLGLTEIHFKDMLEVSSR